MRGQLAGKNERLGDSLRSSRATEAFVAPYRRVTDDGEDA